MVKKPYFFAQFYILCMDVCLCRVYEPASVRACVYSHWLIIDRAWVWGGGRRSSGLRNHKKSQTCVFKVYSRRQWCQSKSVPFYFYFSAGNCRMATKVSRKGMVKTRFQLPRPALQQAVVTVLPVTVGMILLSWLGVFSSATFDTGVENYAERWEGGVPSWLPMPLNTIVNAGYILVCAYWCCLIWQANRVGFVKCQDAFLFYTFNIMGCLYGLIQAYRILYQSPASAIIDQWYTLPFFMMVVVWAQVFHHGWSMQRFVILMFISVASYSLSLVTSWGFEITLGCHISLAIYTVTCAYRKYPSDEALQYFVLGTLSCFGFVILKLLDLILPQFHWIFNKITGHFLSKICDIFQIYYSNEFFFTMIFDKAAAHSVLPNTE